MYVYVRLGENALPLVSNLSLHFDTFDTVCVSVRFQSQRNALDSDSRIN